jgi:peptide/nickel transport system substrate-binding protein
MNELRTTQRKAKEASKMKKTIVLLLILCLAPGVLVLAGGKKEGAPEGVKEETKEMTVEVLQEGETPSKGLDNYKVYATPAEYTKATGKKLPAYKQSPMLDDLVKSGKLPPVAQRLPEEPCVIQPTDRIGTYGGTLTGIRSTGESYAGSPAHLALIVPTGEYIRTLVKDWKVSSDYQTLTIYLRKGTRWSDGEPFTADDIVFWYNDIKMNKELTPALEPKFICGGKPYTIAKVDDYTVSFHSEVPYYGIKTLFNKRSLTDYLEYAPKHYLRKWHIKYNPDANKLAKDEGFDNWATAFDSKNKPILYSGAGPKANPDLPTLAPWRILSVSADKTELERNPYYWAVDTEGNQLPYIDREVEFKVDSRETMLFKIMNGDIDFRIVEWWNAPALIENEQKGNYKIMTTYMGNELAWPNITFNLSNPDPVIGPILRDLRFRRAMSLAVNRQEILDGPWMGVGRICQSTVRDTDPLFKQEWLTNYTKYDPEQANKLLDEMGLKWDSNHQYRQRPDGKRLSILLTTMDWNWPPTEPLIDHWRKVGVEVIASNDDWNLYVEKEESNNFNLTTWTSWSQDFEQELSTGGYDPDGVGNRWAGPWERWWRTSGKQGTEPAEWAKPFFEARAKFLSARNEEEYMKYGQEVWQWLADYLPVIGTVGYPPYPAAVNNRVQNVWPFNVGCFEQEGQKMQWFIQK